MLLIATKSFAQIPVTKWLLPDKDGHAFKIPITLVQYVVTSHHIGFEGDNK